MREAAPFRPVLRVARVALIAATSLWQSADSLCAQPPAFRVGEKVLVPLFEGLPAENGLGARFPAEVVRADAGTLEVRFTYNGSVQTKRVPAAAIGKSLRPDFQDAVLRRHKADVTSITASLLGALTSLSATDGQVKVWDPATNEPVYEVALTKGDKPLVAASGSIISIPGEMGFAVLLGKGVFLMADPAAGGGARDVPGEYLAIAVSGDGKTLGTVQAAPANAQNHTTYVDRWEIAQFAKGGQITSRRTGFALDPTRATLILNDDGEMVYLLSGPANETAPAKLAVRYPGPFQFNPPFFSTLVGSTLAFAHDETIPRLVCGNQLFEVTRVIGDLEGMTAAEARSMTQARFSYSDQWLVTAHRDGQMMFFDAKSGKRVTSFDTGKSIRSLAISLVGNMLATASGPDITLWNVEKILEGTPLARLDRKLARQVWELATGVALIPLTHMTSDDRTTTEKQWSETTAEARKFGAELGALPKFAGDKGAQIRQCVEFISAQSDRLARAIEKQSGARPAHVFKLSAGVVAATVMSPLGNKELNETLRATVRREGLASGIYESVWQPFVVKMVETTDQEALQTAFGELSVRLEEYFQEPPP